MIETMKKKHLSFKKENLLIIFIFILIAIYFVPAILQKEKMFYDDVYSTFTRLIATAKCVKKGEIPLWDKNLFSGARPFYAMMEGGSYNLLLYPFFFITDTNNIDSAFLTLYILPFLFFSVIGIIGTYLFLNKTLKISKIASILSGFLYITTPALTSVSLLCIHDQQIHIFLPWILWSTFSYLKEYKKIWWFISYILLILMFLSFSINYTIRAFFILTFLNGFYSLFLLIKKEIKLSRIINLIFVYILSVGSVSFLWLGVYEGISYLGSKELTTYQQLVEGISNNLYPGQLLTIFIPDFHGLISGKSTWGNSIYSTNGSIPAGGFFTALSLFIYLLFQFSSLKEKKSNEKIIFFLFFTLFIISILVMMGRFTPFFFIFQLILPFFFKVPYPYYYQISANFSYVVLIGLSIDFFIEKKEWIKERANLKTILIFIVIIILLILFAFFEPLYDDLDNNRGYIPAIKSIIEYNEWGWFLLNPILYFLASSIIAILIFLPKKKIETTYLLLFAILAEGFYFGYLNLYKNSVFPDRAKEMHSSPTFRKSFSNRATKPTEYPLLQDAYKLKNFLTTTDRFIGKLSVIDNTAWTIDRYSALAYDSKPITREMYNVVNNIAENYPYELTLKKMYVNYFRNMNIHYVLFFRYQLTNDKLFITKRDDGFLYDTLNEQEIKSLKVNEKLKELSIEPLEKDPTKVNDMSLYYAKVLEPLPYIYTQDRILVTSEENQLDILLKQDLRQYALYETEIDNLTKTTETDELMFLKDNKEFDNLQKINKITKIDREKNNSIKIEIDVKKPCLLIRAETFNPGWSVKVDGKKEKLLKVNYLQQAVFLEKGNHIVEFYFLPKAISKGLAIAIFFILLTVIYIYLFLKQRN